MLFILLRIGVAALAQDRSPTVPAALRRAQSSRHCGDQLMRGIMLGRQGALV